MLPYKWAAEESNPKGWDEYVCHVEVNMYNYDLIRYLEVNGWEKFNQKITYDLRGNMGVSDRQVFGKCESGWLYYGLPFDKVVNKKN